jgi:predicted glutamine amidotransferase
MCGLVGVFQADGYKDKDLVRFMNEGIYVDTLRGGDSTGVFQIPKRIASGYHLYKEAVPGPKFLGHKRAQEILNRSHEAFITVAHNRAATHGNVTQANAHPFAFSKLNDANNFIVGAHNGTLGAWSRKVGDREFEVDSEWAFNQMACHGIEAALESFTGAWAFAVYDSATPSKLYLASNGQRPLHFCFVGVRKTMLFASDARMLALLTDRCNLKPKDGTIFSVKAHTLLAFDASDPTKYTSTDIKIKTVWPAVKASRSAWDREWEEEGVLPRVPRRAEGWVDSFKGEVQDVVKDLLKTRWAIEETQRELAKVFGGKVKREEDGDTEYVDRKERRFLIKHMKIDEDEDGLFYANKWDPRAKVIHGEVTMKIPVSTASRELMTCKFDAQIRQASYKMWQEMTDPRKGEEGNKSYKVLVQAKGAFSPASSGKDIKQRKYVIVVSHPIPREDVVTIFDDDDKESNQRGALH